MIIKIDKTIADYHASYLDNIVSVELAENDGIPTTIAKRNNAVNLEVKVYDKLENRYLFQYITASVVLLDDDGYPL